MGSCLANNRHSIEVFLTLIVSSVSSEVSSFFEYFMKLEFSFIAGKTSSETNNWWRQKASVQRFVFVVLFSDGLSIVQLKARIGLICI